VLIKSHINLAVLKTTNICLIEKVCFILHDTWFTLVVHVQFVLSWYDSFVVYFPLGHFRFEVDITRFNVFLSSTLLTIVCFMLYTLRGLIGNAPFKSWQLNQNSVPLKVLTRSYINPYTSLNCCSRAGLLNHLIRLKFN